MCSSNQDETADMSKIALLMIRIKRSNPANRISRFENRAVNRIFQRFKIKKLQRMKLHLQNQLIFRKKHVKYTQSTQPFYNIDIISQNCYGI